jgi:D-arabinose 1-dehydrogenase-like Zn-dependent alcohol dehydrogenase
MDTYCENLHQFGTHDHDVGSFGSHVVWDADALYIIPESLKSEHAAPLMCGGATVWGALSVYNVRPTDRVGVVGVGGLGHLAIQFAAKMGCDVVAFSSTESKRDEAIAFGAKEFYTTKGVTEFKGLTKLNHLLVTTSEQPDYKTFVSTSIYFNEGGH